MSIDNLIRDAAVAGYAAAIVTITLALLVAAIWLAVRR